MPLLWCGLPDLRAGRTSCSYANEHIVPPPDISCEACRKLLKPLWEILLRTPPINLEAPEVLFFFNVSAHMTMIVARWQCASWLAEVATKWLQLAYWCSS